ncbi:hypothetical protein QR680_005182 [Steinernema hermaphroditum]|uniref:hypoxia-inducible factor-proline dioxygenase n=1 Tax=Steinernema hermaphroditum TaxID=289476 RepID=A0AA39LUE2_9BILA|nr:hypothetical protein QR680_005182 [Steinernema hermaphroditum]
MPNESSMFAAPSSSNYMSAGPSGVVAPLAVANPAMPSSSEAEAWLQHRHDSVASSGSGASSNSSNSLNTVFQRKEGCSFCGVKEKEGKMLFPCPDCNAVMYCGTEHQNYDRKRHKPLCLTVQGQQFRDYQQKLNQQATAKGSSPPKTIQGLQLGSAFSAFSRVTPVAQTAAGTPAVADLTIGDKVSAPSSPPTSTSSNPSGRLIDTAFDDIQIIEQPNEKTKPRRALKDHTKNVVFKTTLQEHMQILTSTGIPVNRHQAIALRLKAIADHVIYSLNEYGWAVVDNFLGPGHCATTNREIETLYNKDLFSDGQLMGKSGENNSDKGIRSDEIYWFDSSDNRAQKASTIRLLVSMIDSVTVHFNGKIPYTISGRSRAMIAVYPGNGTRYVKHVDNPIRDGRCVTSIYYCNENWDLNRDGGTLRLYPESSAVPMDIDPQGDRLVFFWSDRRNPHEVLPVMRNRFAITIWYFDKSEKEESRRRTIQCDSQDHDEIRAKAAKSAVDDTDAGGMSPKASASEDRRTSQGDVQGTHFHESNSFNKNTIAPSGESSMNLAARFVPENAPTSPEGALRESPKVVFGLHPPRSQSTDSTDSEEGDDLILEPKSQEKNPEYEI